MCPAEQGPTDDPIQETNQAQCSLGFGQHFIMGDEFVLDWFSDSPNEAIASTCAKKRERNQRGTVLVFIVSTQNSKRKKKHTHTRP